MRQLLRLVMIFRNELHYYDQRNLKEVNWPKVKTCCSWNYHMNSLFTKLQICMLLRIFQHSHYIKLESLLQAWVNWITFIAQNRIILHQFRVFQNIQSTIYMIKWTKCCCLLFNQCATSSEANLSSISRFDFPCLSLTFSR